MLLELLVQYSNQMINMFTKSILIRWLARLRNQCIRVFHHCIQVSSLILSIDKICYYSWKNNRSNKADSNILSYLIVVCLFHVIFFFGHTSSCRISIFCKDISFSAIHHRNCFCVVYRNYHLLFYGINYKVIISSQLMNTSNTSSTWMCFTSSSRLLISLIAWEISWISYSNGNHNIDFFSFRHRHFL